MLYSVWCPLKSVDRKSLLSFTEIKTSVFVYPLSQTVICCCGIKLNPVDFYSALLLNIILFLVSLQIEKIVKEIQTSCSFTSSFWQQIKHLKLFESAGIFATSMQIMGCESFKGWLELNLHSVCFNSKTWL